MNFTIASRVGRGHGPLPGLVLLGSVLAAAAVILGMLLMHGTGIRSMPSGHHGATTSATTSATTVLAHTDPAGVPGLAPQANIGAAGFAADGSGCVLASYCPCIATACLLALLVVMIRVRRPALGRLVPILARNNGTGRIVILTRHMLTPSLHLLCINRR